MAIKSPPWPSRWGRTLLAPHINAWYLILCVSLAAADDEDRWGKILAVSLCGVMFIDVLTGLPD